MNIGQNVWQLVQYFHTPVYDQSASLRNMNGKSTELSHGTCTCTITKIEPFE